MDLDQLQAAVDEDERVALAAADMAGRDWSSRGGEDEIALHSQRHDPARVLRWVRSAREILDRHESHQADCDPQPWCTWCSRPAAGQFVTWPCHDVRALASVYGDGEEGS